MKVQESKEQRIPFMQKARKTEESLLLLLLLLNELSDIQAGNLSIKPGYACLVVASFCKEIDFK